MAKTPLYIICYLPIIYRLATILSKENCIHVIMLHFSDAIWYNRVIPIERQSCLYTWQQRRKYITWCIWQKSIYEIVDLTDIMCTKDDVRLVWITRCSFSLWFFCLHHCHLQESLFSYLLMFWKYKFGMLPLILARAYCILTQQCGIEMTVFKLRLWLLNNKL